MNEKPHSAVVYNGLLSSCHVRNRPDFARDVRADASELSLFVRQSRHASEHVRGRSVERVLVRDGIAGDSVRGAPPLLFAVARFSEEQPFDAGRFPVVDCPEELPAIGVDFAG